MITNICLRTNDNAIGIGIDITAFDLSDICNTTFDARPNGDHLGIRLDGIISLRDVRRYDPSCFT